MLYATDILSRLAGTVDAPDTIGLRQSSIEIPPALAPTLSLRGPLVRFPTVQTTATQESQLTQRSIAQPASAAAVTQTVATFAEGLWNIRAHLTYAADFTDLTTTRISHFRLSDDLSTEESIVQFIPVALQPYFVTFDWTVLFPVDGWSFDIFASATGAAQTFHLTCSLLASRLT